MYEARQRKEMVSRRIDRGVARSVQQFKLVINGRLKNESVLKRNYYKNILNKEADGNLISRHILRRKISEIVKSNETYNFPTWRQAIISLIETKTMKLGPISSLVNKSYIINLGHVESIVVNGKQCIRAYLAVYAPSPDGSYKDISQDEYGNIKAYAKKNDIFWINFGRPLRAVKWMEKYKAGEDSDPRLRTVLIPFNVLKKIAEKSVIESKRSQHIESSFNVDVHYEPNQFGLTKEDLDFFNKNIIPYSLITYSYNTSNIAKNEGMSIPLSALKDQLGIPKDKDVFNVFTNNKGEFTKRNKFESNANKLMWLFGLMTQSKLFVPKEKEKIPDDKRMDLIKKMLPDINNYSDITQEKINTIALWASQARISQLLASDFDESVENMKKEE